MNEEQSKGKTQGKIVWRWERKKRVQQAERKYEQKKDVDEIDLLWWVKLLLFESVNKHQKQEKPIKGLK